MSSTAFNRTYLNDIAILYKMYEGRICPNKVDYDKGGLLCLISECSLFKHKYTEYIINQLYLL